MRGPLRLVHLVVLYVLLAPTRAFAPELYALVASQGFACGQMVHASASAEPLGRSGIPISLLEKKITEINESGTWKHILMGVRQYVVDMPNSRVSPEETARAKIAILYDMMCILRDDYGVQFGVNFLPGRSRLFFGPDKRIGIIVRFSDGAMFQGIVSAKFIDDHTRMPNRDWEPSYATQAEEQGAERVPDIFYRLTPGWRP